MHTLGGIPLGAVLSGRDSRVDRRSAPVEESVQG